MADEFATWVNGGMPAEVARYMHCHDNPSGDVVKLCDSIDVD